MTKQKEIDLAASFVDDVENGIVPTIPDFRAWKTSRCLSQEIRFPHPCLDKFITKHAIALGRAKPGRGPNTVHLPQWFLRQMTDYLKEVEPPTPTQAAVREYFKDKAPRQLVDACFNCLRPDRDRTKGPRGPRTHN
jgi:hypothetical protein